MNFIYELLLLFVTLFLDILLMTQASGYEKIQWQLQTNDTDKDEMEEEY